jgi:hypothetical protein
MANGIQAELLIICVIPTIAFQSSVMELWKWVKQQSSETRVASQVPQNQTANPSLQTGLADTTTNSIISGGVYANSQAVAGRDCDNEQGGSLELSRGSVALGWKELP